MPLQAPPHPRRSKTQTNNKKTKNQQKGRVKRCEVAERRKEIDTEKKGIPIFNTDRNRKRKNERHDERERERGRNKKQNEKERLKTLCTSEDISKTITTTKIATTNNNDNNNNNTTTQSKTTLKHPPKKENGGPGINPQCRQNIRGPGINS